MLAPLENVASTVEIGEGLLGSSDVVDQKKRSAAEEQGLEQPVDDSSADGTTHDDLEAGKPDPIYVRRFGCVHSSTVSLSI